MNVSHRAEHARVNAITSLSSESLSQGDRNESEDFGSSRTGSGEGRRHLGIINLKHESAAVYGMIRSPVIGQTPVPSVLKLDFGH